MYHPLGQLTKKDISNNFDNKTVSRGYTYHLHGHVQEYDIEIEDEENGVIYAKVKGTHTYKLHIDFYDYDTLDISSSCTCPVGFNCKHAVAVLFQIIADKGTKKTVHTTSNWLNTFLKTSAPKNILPNDNETSVLIYRLFREKGNDFDFCKAKILKSGSLSKGTKVSHENMIYYSAIPRFHNYDYLSDEDRVQIQKLAKLSNGRHSSSYSFTDEYGAFMIRQIVSSGKCYLRDASVPLSYEDEKKNLTFKWVETEESYRLTPNLVEGEEILICTVPAFCINSQKNTLSEVTSGYSKQELTSMFDAPKMTRDEMTKVTHSIMKESLDIPFPVPEVIEIKEIDVEPKPYLYLYGKESGANIIHMMELHFLYDNYEVNVYPFRRSDTISQGSELIKIIRNEPVESSCRESLENLGFTYENTMQTYMSFANPSMQVAIERWRDFMENRLETLRKEGWSTEVDDSFSFQFEYADTITVQSSEESKSSPWFELSFSVDIGGKTVVLMPIVSTLLEEYSDINELPERLNLAMGDGKFLHIESKDIKPILQTVFELFDKKEGDKLIVKPYDAHLMALDEKDNIVWKGAKELLELSKKLKNFNGIDSVTPAKTLNATLRGYQQFGLDWLHFLYSFKFGGILADDMGLGKTVQTLAFLQLLKSRGELELPVLIVMPTSLIGNWKNEIVKFTPELTYLELYGSDRAKKFEHLGDYDIVLTTYQLAQRDAEKFINENFLYIILDEAQKIKNPKTKMALAIKSFSSKYRLALSGTPIENNLGELWSIFDFLMPGFLDSLSLFKNFYQIPIEKENNITRRDLLNKKISPFILRRTKNEVALELPSKTEIVKKAVFDKKQAKLYENIRVTMEKKVRETIKGKGLSRSHITILDALLKLRQVCCHPQLLKLESAKDIHDSAKLELFLELIDELQAEGRKVLVFSQFTSMLGILEEEIKKKSYTYTKLTGSTRKRDEAIKKFTEGDAGIFLISLKAGGVGLNLVAADTVIHYDPWWNPAVENQATDRAYRIGQDKPVFVYKLIVENSIEEQILKLQEKKKSLQDSIYKGKENKEEKFNGEELVALLKI